MKGILIILITIASLKADYKIQNNLLTKKYQQMLKEKQEEIVMLKQENKELKKLYVECINYTRVLKKEDVVLMIVGEDDEKAVN